MAFGTPLLTNWHLVRPLWDVFHLPRLVCQQPPYDPLKPGTSWHLVEHSDRPGPVGLTGPERHGPPLGKVPPAKA